MENNICSKCNTENEPHYTYCKNCGNPLQKSHSNDNQNTSYSYNAPFQNPASNNIHIGGISSEEMSLFIGKKATNIIPKFIKMELTGSKFSWCWPAAILGLFFGPMGAAIWFFYRKMPKIATILSVIGALTTIFASIIQGFINPELSGIIEEALANEDIYAIYNSIFSLSVKDLLLIISSTLISDAVDIATLIICGLFGYNFYKKHCIGKIYSLRMYQQNPQYYNFGLSATGGTSGGLLALGIVILVAVSNIASIFTTLLPTLLK